MKSNCEITRLTPRKSGEANAVCSEVQSTTAQAYFGPFLNVQKYSGYHIWQKYKLSKEAHLRTNLSADP